MYITLPIISGILSALPFINFSLFPVSWFALAPLLFSLYNARTEKEASIFGFVFGFFFFGISLFWVTELSNYVSFVAYLAWFTLISVQSLFLAAFGFVNHVRSAGMLYLG